MDKHKILRSLIAFLSGALMAVGISVAELTEPQKVLNFLDFGGGWDPSLVFVFIGAIAVHFFAFKYVFKQKKPLFDTKLRIPEVKNITPSLIIGSIIFGLGWGISGYSPESGLTAFVSGDWGPIAFTIAITVGMIAHHFLKPLWEKPKDLIGEDL